MENLRFTFDVDPCIFNNISSFLPQVQLLVTTSDVDNYKQIKADLDELRNLVEKSELWVYKVKHDEKRKSSPQNEDKVNDEESWFVTKEQGYLEKL